MLDLAREPRWGRTEETYGEDPYLVTRIGVAAIEGFQGNGPFLDKSRVFATAKHFAVHGQPEGGTNAAPGNYSERVIREYFLKPFEAHNTAEFTMLPQGDGATNISWLMHGPAPFMSKMMQVFMNIDKMVGKDFEIGLSNLKKLTEK